MKKSVVITLIILISIIVATIVLADDVMGAVICDNDGNVLGSIDADSIHKGEWMETYIQTDLMITLDRRLLEEETVKLEIDPTGMRVGYFIEGKWHVIDSEKSRKILSDPIFNEYYPLRNPPALNCSINGAAKFPIAETIEWVVTLPDGNTTTKLEESNAIEFLTLPVNSVMALGFDLVPDKLVIEDSAGNITNISGGLFNIPDREENLEYTVIASWNQSDFAGRMVYRFNVIVDLPIKTRIVGSEIKPGEFFSLVVENSEVDGELSIEQPFANKVDCYEFEKSKWYLIPVNYWTEPGNYSIKVNLLESNTAIEVPIDIKSKKFDIQYLYVDEAIEQSTRSDEAYEEFALYMNPARETSVSEPLFDGLFIQPVEGRISTEFGMYRYVNDSMTSYRHSGIDIAIDRGTPIQATNSGLVALSRNLILTGNTIVIDHGVGIFSVYFHMDSLSVKKGDRVEKGDIIGEVGTTGFSTGPHLHWTMSYYKTNLDPYQFMETEILQQ